jgi:nuclear receptor interaction protein
MQQSYEIVSQNDVERQGGMQDAFITVRADGPFERMRRVEVGFAEWIGWFGG